MTAELYGLVLAGGHSRRMQRDKATLAYGGQPALVRAMRLLEPHVARAFVSIRADQRDDPRRAPYEPIVDRRLDMGPIAGIDAALHAHPDKAWLVLACDLPFLNASTLAALIAAREPHRTATAYRSSYDGKPEPLCTIFEPRARSAIDTWIQSGHLCPREFLSQSDARLLDAPEPHALDNINTGEEYLAAQAALSLPSMPRQLRVQYFALLREQAGRGSEQLTTSARTPRELYEELRSRRGLTLAPQFLRVAVNDEFGDWAQPLRDGDTVVFLPPVAGG
jgi:molybdopterin-guanine dinucleotide biosynthesis protein A